MNTKSILFTSCVAAMTLSVSVAMAGPHGGSAGGGFSGGGFRGGGGGFRGGSAPARMTPVSQGPGRALVPECPETFGTLGEIAIGSTIATSMNSFSSVILVIRSFIPTTGIIPTAIILTGIILTATDTATDTDTILTINPVIRVWRPVGVPRLPKSSSVWRVQAITGAGSTESWVLEHVMQCELTNAPIIRA